MERDRAFYLEVRGERLALLPGSVWREAGLPGLNSADTILLPDPFARAAHWTHAVGWSFYNIARPILSIVVIINMMLFLLQQQTHSDKNLLHVFFSDAN